MKRGACRSWDGLLGAMLLVLGGCVSAAVLGDTAGATDAAVTAPVIDASLVAPVDQSFRNPQKVHTLKLHSEVVGETGAAPRDLVKRQLLYTVGALQKYNGSANFGSAEISLGAMSAAGEGLVRIAYDAELQAVFPKQEAFQFAAEIPLPMRVDPPSIFAFAAKYKDACGKSVVPGEEGQFFYSYRPAQVGCALEAADVFRSSSQVVAPLGTAPTTYPEYDRMWADGRMHIVIVMGRYLPGTGMSRSDPFAAIYWELVEHLHSALQRSSEVRELYTQVPNPRGTPVERATWTVDNANRGFKFDLFLVDAPQSGGVAFDAELKRVSADADFLSYAGHAGLGANLAAFLQRIELNAGQYHLLHLDNCISFAYPDFRLLKNPASVSGRYGTQDVVVNSASAKREELKPDLLNWLLALTNPNSPKPYSDILRMNSTGRPLVLFDEDNTFQP